jgi:hypothetical protein
LSTAFNNGLPVKRGKEHDAASDSYKEFECIEHVVQMINPQLNKKDFFLDSTKQGSIPDVTNGEKDEAFFNVGYNESEVLHNYSAVKFFIKDANKSTNIGSNFCANTKLCGREGAVIVVDFNQNGFLSKLKQGENSSNPGHKIHYIMTPEIVNDPAGKTPVHDKSVFNSDLGKGVPMISYVNTDPYTLCYTTYDQNNPSSSNNFFSAFNFKLSPLKSNYINKNEKLVTTLTIYKYNS